jgi:hypothetical protein
MDLSISLLSLLDVFSAFYTLFASLSKLFYFLERYCLLLFCKSFPFFFVLFGLVWIPITTILFFSIDSSTSSIINFISFTLNWLIILFLISIVFLFSFLSAFGYLC